MFNPETGSYELRLDPQIPGRQAPQPHGHHAPGPHGHAPHGYGGPPQQPQQYIPQQSGQPSHGQAAPGPQHAQPPHAQPHPGPPQPGQPHTGGPPRPGDRHQSHASPAEAPESLQEPRLPSQRRRGAAGGSGGAGGSGPDGDGPRSRRRPKPRKSKKKKALIWVAGGLAVVLFAVGTAAFLIYRKLNGNIDKVEVAGEDHAAVIDGPVNILVMGTDKRTGKGNDGYGDMNSPGHADTTLLFHVSEDRTNATAMSIPRDMITDIPDCKTKQEDGSWKTIPGTYETKFNESLGQFGRDPGCTWKTVEQLTGLDVNHFILADFNAVKDLSSAVGGVEVCLAEDINDPKSKLNLPAGRHTVEGEEALAFVRTRYSVGFGSDLSRIELQQQFLSSLIRKMKSGGSLSNPKKMYDLADAATKALTVDSGIGSAKKLMDLANDLKKVPQDDITFATLPVLDNPEDDATVLMDEAKAKPLFKLLAADKPFDGAKKGKKDKPVKKSEPGEVRVDVVNGGGESGMASATAGWLLDEGAGYAAEAGNTPDLQPETRLEYGPDQAEQAARLADMMGLPKSAMKKTGENAGAGGTMTLTLGEDFAAPGTPVEAPDKAPDGVQNVKAGDKNVCAK
ncbi:LytR family transcriptional regulator [Streptomyces sp. CNQ-509]|uniref:LCP family protein n=1 Tax=unclassified Streptomyces TaxID=2593676 RepID=UPI00062DDA17|nr:LCP family protein [Streptomyces sp. CNQ-509]AKH82742.1 LytR family transcriptional regulator [Streptomyces sp. CNQ-509]